MNATYLPGRRHRVELAGGGARSFYIDIVKKILEGLAEPAGDICPPGRDVKYSTHEASEAGAVVENYRDAEAGEAGAVA